MFTYTCIHVVKIVTQAFHAAVTGNSATTYVLPRLRHSHLHVTKKRGMGFKFKTLFQNDNKHARTIELEVHERSVEA